MTFYYTTGHVGIGTTTPDYALQIHNAAQSIWRLIPMQTGAANTAQLAFVSDYDGTQAYSSIGQFNTADLKFSSIGNLVSPDMTLAAATGYLGIGTTTPANLIDIYGNINSPIGARVTNSSAGNGAIAAFTVQNDSGNVGRYYK